MVDQDNLVQVEFNLANQDNQVQVEFNLANQDNLVQVEFNLANQVKTEKSTNVIENVENLKTGNQKNDSNKGTGEKTGINLELIQKAIR